MVPGPYRARLTLPPVRPAPVTEWSVYFKEAEKQKRTNPSPGIHPSDGVQTSFFFCPKVIILNNTSD